MDASRHHAIEEGAKLIAEEAKRELGHYQAEAGPFPAWEPLHESTLHGGRSPKTGALFKGKIELGFATEADHNPLMRTGELRDSIGYRVEGDKGVVGSTSKYAAVQELGDPENNQPPRSFLGRAAFLKGKEAAHLAAEGFLSGLLRRTLTKVNRSIGNS
jgi:phage gpG-like protein